MCGKEGSVLWHQCVAWKLHCCTEESSAEGDESCTENCLYQPPHHHEHLHFSEEGHLHYGSPLTQHTHTHIVSCFPQEGSIKCKNTRLRNLIPEAVRLLNRNNYHWHFTQACSFIHITAIMVIYADSALV